VYDLKKLALMLKDDGLDVAEDAAGKLVNVVFSWMEDAALASENKYDDMAIGLLKPLKAYVMSQVDKIDGKVDQEPEA